MTMTALLSKPGDWLGAWVTAESAAMTSALAEGKIFKKLARPACRGTNKNPVFAEYRSRRTHGFVVLRQQKPEL